MNAMGCTKENPRWEITRMGTIAYRAKLEYGAFSFPSTMQNIFLSKRLKVAFSFCSKRQ